MNTILKATQERLAELTELKYIDENWGQLDLFGPEIPVQWPAALIAVQGAQFSNLGRDNRATPPNRQEGVLAIEISIAKMKLTNGSFRATQLQKTHAFEVWDIVQKVHEKLHGWNALPEVGKMVRTQLATVRRDDGVQEIRITYTVGLHDC